MRRAGLTKNRRYTDIFVRPRQAKKKASDHPSSAEDHCASSMICQRVHGNGEGQNVRTTNEDQDENRAESCEFASYAPSYELTAIGERLHLGESELEFTD